MPPPLYFLFVVFSCFYAIFQVRLGQGQNFSQGTAGLELELEKKPEKSKLKGGGGICAPRAKHGIVPVFIIYLPLIVIIKMYHQPMKSTPLRQLKSYIFYVLFCWNRFLFFVCRYCISKRENKIIMLKVCNTIKSFLKQVNPQISKLNFFEKLNNNKLTVSLKL